ncbi:hypothetical protein [Enterococcus faecium]|nr:hypothetical protein [Enterococcus faecium]
MINIDCNKKIPAILNDRETDIPFVTSCGMIIIENKIEGIATCMLNGKE